jgi:hypothetical protein
MIGRHGEAGGEMTGERLALPVGVALCVSALLNGLLPYLRRIGVAEPSQYRAYWSVHCIKAGGTKTGPGGMGLACAAPDVEPPSAERYWRERIYWSHVQTVGTHDIPLKVAKDAVAAFIIAAGLVGAHRTRVWQSVRAIGWPALGLIIWVAGAAVRTTLDHGAWATVAGVRTFFLLPVAWALARIGIPRCMDQVARALAALLVVELVLCVPELMYGMPIHGHLPDGELPSRLAGTLVQPNSLGVTAAIILAFILSFGVPVHWTVIAASVTVVALAG